MNNQTVIDTVVKYSKDCITKRFIKEYLSKAMMLATSQNLPSSKTISIILQELDIRLDEKESDIGKLLEPLFEGHDFGHKTSKKHSLTISEIRDGFMLLEGEKYIILLRPFKSPQTGLEYVPGVLYKIGSGLLDEDIKAIKRSKEEIIPEDLFTLIIKKKIAYEYIERHGDDRT